MTRPARWIAMVVWAVGAASPAYAADKTHQQMMAEIRMLQEQQQQLQQMLGGLAETLAQTLKTMTSKIDDQSGATRKGFADQRLLIESVSETARILREKADDTNVRLSSMTQELEAIRHTIASQPQTPAAAIPGQEPVPGNPGPPAGSPSAVTPPPPGVSPQRMFDEAFSDYTRGDYDLAIEGFQTYIRMFPRTDRTDDAQLKIGDSLHAAKRFTEAIAAFQKVTSDYPQSDSVPAAHYKLGLSYEALKQPELARKSFETVIKNHGGSNEAILAKQRLDVLTRGR
jgi:tol-pal system protein YbgF